MYFTPLNRILSRVNDNIPLVRIIAEHVRMPVGTAEEDRIQGTQVSTSDNLTKYEDNAGVTKVDVDAVQLEMLSNTDPYKTESLATILSRSYKIGGFNWPIITTVGTLLFETSFPEALFTIPFIKDKLEDYMMFRSSVKVSLRINATKFSYGALMIGWVPFYKKTATGAFRTRDLTKLSQCNSKVLSVSSGESIEFEIPWITPYAYCDTAAVGVTQLGWGGYMAIRCLNPLKSASANPPDSIQISVFANFVNPEVAGYSPESTVGEIMVQSGMSVEKEAIAKEDVFVGMPEAIKTVSGLLGSVVDTASNLGGVFEKALPFLSMAALNKPNIVNTPQPTYPVYDTSLNYGKGVDRLQKQSLDPNNVISVNPAIIGTEDAQPTILSIIKQPTFYQTFEILSTTVIDQWFYVRPINPVECAKGTTVGIYAEYRPTYMAYYSQFANYWRGSIKVYLQFVTSAFVTTRVRVAHFPEIQSFSAPLDSYSGDMISKVVDIAGDTVLEFTLPYLAKDHYKACDAIGQTSAENSIGVWGVSLVNPIVSTDSNVDASVYMNVWYAAGDDFTFMEHLAINDKIEIRIDDAPPPEPEEIIEVQSDMKLKFASDFPGLIPCSYNPEIGVINGENFGRITDLLHRYSELNSKVTANAYAHLAIVGYEDAAAYEKAADDLSALCLPFLFWRGGLRLMYVPQSATEDVVISKHVNEHTRDKYRNGLTRNFFGQNPLPGLEFPWYRPELFAEIVPTQTTTHYSFKNINVTVVPTPPIPASKSCIYSIGDDFSLGPLSSCPSVWSEEGGDLAKRTRRTDGPKPLVVTPVEDTGLDEWVSQLSVTTQKKLQAFVTKSSASPRI